jgi:hypothetical protein
MSDQKTTIVATEFGDVTVRKLALKDYGLLLRALKKIPSILNTFYKDKGESEMKTEDILPVLPVMIADALPEVIEILSIATDKDTKFIEKLDLADTINVLYEALVINDYSRVAETIKKITARVAKPAADPEPTS